MSKNYYERFVLLQYSCKLVETFHKGRSRQNFIRAHKNGHSNNKDGHF